MTIERDEKLLRELGHYHLGLRYLMAFRHFGGNEKALDGVLTRLIEQNRIRVHKNCLPGGHSIYQLTKASALTLGFSEARAQKIGPRALPEHLSVLWFCCAYNGIQRTRLEDAQLVQLLGQRLPGVHCAEVGFTTAGRPVNRIYRVFVPGNTAEDTYTIKKIRDTLDEVRRLHERGSAKFSPAEWLAERRYGIAVLVDTESRRKRFLELFKREGFFEETHLLVERSISPETLTQNLQEVLYVRNESTHQLDSLPLPTGGGTNGSHHLHQSPPTA